MSMSEKKDVKSMITEFIFKCRKRRRDVSRQKEILCNRAENNNIENKKMQ